MSPFRFRPNRQLDIFFLGGGAAILLISALLYFNTPTIEGEYTLNGRITRTHLDRNDATSAEIKILVKLDESQVSVVDFDTEEVFAVLKRSQLKLSQENGRVHFMGHRLKNHDALFHLELDTINQHQKIRLAGVVDDSGNYRLFVRGDSRRIPASEQTDGDPEAVELPDADHAAKTE